MSDESSHAAPPPTGQARLLAGDDALLRKDHVAARAAYIAAQADPAVTPAAWFGLATIAQAEGDSDAATAWYRRVIALHPDNGLLWGNFANLLMESGDACSALPIFGRAAQLTPDDGKIASNRIMALHYAAGVDDATIWAATRAAARRLPPEGRVPPLAPVSAEPRRVGFVSPDLVSHPVGYFLQPVLAQLDPKRYQPYLYFTGTYRDGVTEQFQRSAAWRDVAALPNEALFQQIRDDRIDILIDLSGHTRGHRLALFAARAAPVQMSWLGFYDTTGVAAIDYALMDRWHVPDGQEHRFNERVLRLPHSRFCYAALPLAPAVAPPPALRGGTVTFGSINNIAKINGEVIALWAEILRRLPGSRLLLKWHSLAAAGTRDRMAEQFAQAGVAHDRLELRPGSPQEVVLRQYADIDIALDPFPFTGGYTSCEALWMGLPVVTLPGARPASRHTLSLIGSLNRPDWLAQWVAADARDYVDKALALAGDLFHLVEIRASLRDVMRASPLMDSGGFARALEDLFDTAIREKAEGSAVTSRITIDNVAYDGDRLPDAAKQQLVHIQFADAEIQRLQMLLALAQTARAAYGAALKDLLPKA